MQTALDEINAVLGVTGSFTCNTEGIITAQAMPPSFESSQLSLAARVASQTLNALETSGQRVTEVDLIFGSSRILLKNLRGGALVIFCASGISIPLLNLTANVAAKKIAAELRPPKPKSPASEAKRESRASSAPPKAVEPPVPPIPAAPPAAARPVEPTPRIIAPPAEPLPSPPDVAPPVIDSIKLDTAPTLYAELEQEMYRLIIASQRAKLVLRALDPLAIWLCCPRTKRLLTPPETKRLSFAARMNQGPLVSHLIEQAGFQPNQRFNAFYGARRLYFNHPTSGLIIEIYLDSFDMYLHLDLASVLEQPDVYAPETPLCLMRLQLIEMSDAALRDLCALFLEHELNAGPGPEKINMRQIADLCAEEWSWYRAITMNLDRVAAFAPKVLDPVEQATMIDRVRQLRQQLEATPKSLRWQMRARLGDGVRWYDTPMAPSTTSRPDMAFG